jgi:hypothetical protein
MPHDWQELTKLTQDQAFVIERIRLINSGIAIEGAFEPPKLSGLTAEDQVFVAAFVRCHGSIKEMERFFGVSYPTIKNRLNRIGEQLAFVAIEQGEPEAATAVEPESESPETVLDRLSRGEIDVKAAINKLKGGTR